MEIQAAAQNRHVLDRLLDPVRDVLTPEVARAIADLRADATTQGRLDDLADRHHEGQLSPEELAEYQALVSGINLVAVLQAKARSVLKAKALWRDRCRYTTARPRACGRPLRVLSNSPGR